MWDANEGVFESFQIAHSLFTCSHLQLIGTYYAAVPLSNIMLSIQVVFFSEFINIAEDHLVM